MSLRKLSDSDVESLIKLWKNERALWDVTFPKYANADERKAALSRISRGMDNLDTGMSVMRMELDRPSVVFVAHSFGTAINFLACFSDMPRGGRWNPTFFLLRSAGFEKVGFYAFWRVTLRQWLNCSAIGGGSLGLFLTMGGHSRVAKIIAFCNSDLTSRKSLID